MRGSPLPESYPQEEIESLIKEAGMDLLAVYDAYTMEPATKDSERMFLLQGKKEKINKRGTDRI